MKKLVLGLMLVLLVAGCSNANNNNEGSVPAMNEDTENTTGLHEEAVVIFPASMVEGNDFDGMTEEIKTAGATAIVQMMTAALALRFLRRSWTSYCKNTNLK